MRCNLFRQNDPQQNEMALLRERTSLDGGIAIDNLCLAQAEKDQAVAGFVQALRGQWLAHYRLRRLTLFDFEAGQVIH
jgi:hypothetical protein